MKGILNISAFLNAKDWKIALVINMLEEVMKIKTI